MRTSAVRTATARILLVAAVAAILLTGCTSGGATPNGATTPKPTRSATATATPPPKPVDALFTISANVRGKDGSTIGIRMTVQKPVPYSDVAAKPLETTFIAQCGAGVGGTPITTASLETNGAILVPISLASSTSGKPFVSSMQVAVGSANFAQSATGKGLVPVDPSQPCYGGYTWSSSGAASAIADFESGTPAPDAGLWRYGYYGFGITDGSSATIEACTVTLTPLAIAADVASVNGWNPSAAQSGKICGIGYSGE